MMERRAILKLWDSQPEGADGVLATVVRVGGSSYRRAGAHLLIASTGSHAGSISGGCLEEEVIRKARWLTSSGPVLNRYTTFFDDPAEMPYGLGCGGTVEVLLERTSSKEARGLHAATDAALRGHSRVVATMLPEQGPLSRVIWDERFDCIFSTAPGSGIDLESTLRRLPMQRTTGIYQAEVGRRERRVFFEFLEPQPALYLFGAGDDAKPVADFAGRMGWNVIVSDSRSDLATQARFPSIDVKTLSAASLVALVFRPSDAAVIMSHSYEQDRGLLKALLPKPLGYLGLLGARSRSRDLIAQVASDLGWRVDDCLARLHAPVGLDLGGDGCEAIALAIVAEVHAHFEGSSGRPRAMRLEEFDGVEASPPRRCAQ